MTRDVSPTWQEDEYRWRTICKKTNLILKWIQIQLMKKEIGANWIGKKQKARYNKFWHDRKNYQRLKTQRFTKNK